MVKIIDTLLGKNSTSSDDEYMDLDLSSYEEHGRDSPALLVKIATIADLKDTPRVKDEVYNGNIVIVDISRLKMDKISYE
ncbi:MAG: hypothetical protein ABSG06_05205, partial [Methanoregula sp.]